MAIDPNISLGVRPIQPRSPLETIQRTVAVADMLAQTQERQQMNKVRQTQLPIIKAETDAKIQQLKEDALLKHANEISVKYDPELGDIAYDQAKAADFLTQQNALHLLPKYQAGIDASTKAHRDRAIEEMTDHVKQLELVATPAANFLALPEEKQAAAWPDLRANLTVFDKTVGKVLPYSYDPEVVKPKLQNIADAFEQTKTVKQKLDEAAGKEKALKDLADRKKVEADTAKLDAEAKEEKKVDEYTNAEGKRVIALQKKDGTIRYQESPDEVKADKKDEKAVERELVEEAFGQLKLKGKTRDKMTAAEKVAAMRWNEANNANPDKKTDLDKMMQLYRSGKSEDLALFNALKGNFDNGPTVGQKVSMMNSIIGSSSKFSGGPLDPKLYEQTRNLYKTLWPEVPSFEDAQKIAPKAAPPAPATTPAPAKPKSAPKSASKAAIEKAAKDAGIDSAAALKQWTDAGNTITP